MVSEIQLQLKMHEEFKTLKRSEQSQFGLVLKCSSS